MNHLKYQIPRSSRIKATINTIQNQMNFSPILKSIKDSRIEDCARGPCEDKCVNRNSPQCSTCIRACSYGLNF